MARSMTTLMKLNTNALTKIVQQMYTSRAATCGPVVLGSVLRVPHPDVTGCGDTRVISCSVGTSLFEGVASLGQPGFNASLGFPLGMGCWPMHEL
jgi:hypothetical protein